MIQNENWKKKFTINLKISTSKTKALSQKTYCFFFRCKECDCIIAWVVHCWQNNVIYNYVITTVYVILLLNVIRTIKIIKQKNRRDIQRHVESEKFELCQKLNSALIASSNQIARTDKQTNEPTKPKIVKRLSFFKLSSIDRLNSASYFCFFSFDVLMAFYSACIVIANRKSYFLAALVPMHINQPIEKKLLFKLFLVLFFSLGISNVPPNNNCSCLLQHFWLYRLLPQKSLMQSKTSKAIRKMWNAVSSVWAMADMEVMEVWEAMAEAWAHMAVATMVVAWADTTVADIHMELRITHPFMSHHTHIRTALKPKSSLNHIQV